MFHFMKTVLLFVLMPCLLFSCKTKQWNLNTHIEERQNLTKASDTPKPEVLFVQWQYPSNLDSLQVVEKREEIENRIGKALKKQSLGRWITGDLGPGVANMLFEVKVTKQSLDIILQIFKEYNLEDQLVIVQRAYRSSTDWNYKIIYPKDFKGEFTDR